MQYFSDNLTEDELKTEYHKLAKKYHPDLCKDPDAVAIMAEINHQFDEYFTNQKIREFAWVDLDVQRRKARAVRDTLLVYLLRGRNCKTDVIPGEWYTKVEYRSRRYSYDWMFNDYFDRNQYYIGVTPFDSDEWKDFRGGLAYCSYDQPDNEGIVRLTRLPATITPATEEELYWYIKDHFGDDVCDYYQLVKCRFGEFWARTEGNHGFIFFAKAELPKEFLEIGSVDEDGEAKYSARSINTVYVDQYWIREYKIIDDCNGRDFRYRLFQECEYSEFAYTHDIDWEPPFIGSIPCRKLQADDLYFADNPMIMYFAKKEIIKVYCARANFRARFGTFDSNGLRKNLHLLTIDDAEMLQDFLDKINRDFEKYVRGLVKRGAIQAKI